METRVSVATGPTKPKKAGLPFLEQSCCNLQRIRVLLGHGLAQWAPPKVKGAMNVGELIDALNEMLEDGDVSRDTKVLSMTQPQWPFINSVKGIVTSEQLEEEDVSLNKDAQDAIFLVEGSQLCYGSKTAWKLL
jgi:hypothetical protein